MSNLALHETWSQFDSSKVTTFCECPRSFFFRYVLGWTSTTPNNHLVFGEAWHEAMEHLLLLGYESKNIGDAYDKFLACYRKTFAESTDALFTPKTPERALHALVKYVEQYENYDKFDTIYTEIGGTVMLTEKYSLTFRMDSILLDSKGKYFSLEHKTGSRRGRTWTDQWTLSIQAGTYNHVLRCLYPAEEVRGVMINGTFFSPKETNFERVPVYKTNLQMEAWRTMMKYWLESISLEFETLSHATESDNILLAFPQNPTSCTKYFGCPYMDFCSTYPNPLAQNEPPMGFEVKFWNPLDRPVKYKFDL